MLEIKYINSSPVSQLNVENVIFFHPVLIYTDGNNKFAKISFTNKFNEALSSISFKISQYNKDNKCLKREIKTIPDLCIRTKKQYIHDDLIKIDSNVDRFEIEVISMRFITIAYDNGSLSSACIKVDKKALRKENKRNKKMLKHPDKYAKKAIKEVKEYSFTTLFRKKGAMIASLVFAFFIIAIILISLIYSKNPSPDSPFYFNLIKGGLF